MSVVELDPAILEAPVPVEIPAEADSAGGEGASAGRNWSSTASLLTVVTVLVSLGNYVYSFLIVHLMNAQEFSRFSGASGLMLVLGSGCMAAIPWAMAKFISEREDRRSQQEAMHFGLVASSLQGLIFALVAGAILWAEAGPGVGAMVAVGAFAGSMMAVPIGFLQGVDRLVAITIIRVIEFVTRFATGMVILLFVSRSASAALVGYPIGALALILAGLWVSRRGLPPVSGEQDTIRGLVRQSANLGAIQVFLSMLGALDTVAALGAHLGTIQTASYQSAALLGRIPLFLSAAISLAAYVHIVAAKDDAEVREKMGQAARLYSLVVVPFVIACLTVPDGLLHILIPARYSDATALLRFTAISGAAVGWIDIVSTAHQARNRFRTAIRILGVAAVAQPVVLICAGRVSGIWPFASAAVTVSVLAAVALSVDARHWLPRSVSPRSAALWVAVLVLAALTHGLLVLWLVLIAAVGVFALRQLRGQNAAPATSPGGVPAAEPAPETVNDIDSEDVALDPIDPQLPVIDQGPVLTLGRPALPAHPRVVIIGDSQASGLGVHGNSFGRIAATDLEASEVLDLSAISKSTGETLRTEAERIRAFKPDLAIVQAGGTESLVHPAPPIQAMIERYGPASIKGLAGLQPRPYYSGDLQRRLRQRAGSKLRVWLKNTLIRLGGERRIPLSQYRTDLHGLIDLLDEVGARAVFVSMWHIDDRLFPGTEQAMVDTQVVLEETLADREDMPLVDIREAMHYYDDFLYDRLHFNTAGHWRVAELVVEASESLMAPARPALSVVPALIAAPASAPASATVLTAPRVLTLGDSVACGLGVYGQSFGKLASEALGAEETLDLTGISRSVGETLDLGDQIHAFKPTLAIIGAGTTESLVHPGPIVQQTIERFGPKSWNGMAGLEPRPYFSGDARNRLRQRINSALKVVVKRLMIKLTGGGRRISAQQFGADLSLLVALLSELGCPMIFVGTSPVDESLFPGTGRTLADTQRVLERTLQGRSDTVLIDPREHISYWDDFLRDRLHLNDSGHQKLAAAITEAAGTLGGARSADAAA